MLRKWMISIVLPICLFLSSTLTGHAASEKVGEYSVFVEQEMNIFTASEIESLLQMMKQGNNNGNLGIYVFSDQTVSVSEEVIDEYGFTESDVNTMNYFIQEGIAAEYFEQLGLFPVVKRRTEKDTVDYAFNVYEQTYGKQNGSVLVIDMATRYIEIINQGENAKKIDSYRAAIITDNIYGCASREEYYNAAKKGMQQIINVLDGKRIPQTMRILCNIFFAVILSLILNYYLLKATSKLPKVSRKTMLKATDVSYNVKDERFTYTHSEMHDFEAGSLEAIAKTKDVKLRIAHIFFLILQILFFILKAAFSGSSGGGSGRSGGSHSSGGSRSSGGHRF